MGHTPEETINIDNNKHEAEIPPDYEECTADKEEMPMNRNVLLDYSQEYSKNGGGDSGNGKNGNAVVVAKYSGSDSDKRQTQSLFEIVYDIIREKEQRTKEMGTLIRK